MIPGKSGSKDIFGQGRRLSRSLLPRSPFRGTSQIFEEVWELLERTEWLDENKQGRDKERKNWVLYAAEAGNLGIFDKLGPRDLCAELETKDERGWNGFMYAVRGRGTNSVEFLNRLGDLCFSQAAGPGMLRQQLTRSATDDDRSTMLAHAAIGGYGLFSSVCKMMREARCAGLPDERQNMEAVLLSWAAEGGNIDVLTVVAGGVKVRVRV